jgi:anti-sigma B factor antagonist
VRELRRVFDQLAEEGHKLVVLNMANVPYIDSAGLGTLITGLTLFKKNGGTLILSNVQPRIEQLLELTNLAGVIRSFPAEEAALRSLNEDSERTVS